MKTKIIIILLAVFCFVSVKADTIYKKNGEIIEGVVTDISVEGQLGVKTGNSMFFIMKADIEKIDYSPKQAQEEGPNLVMIIAITACCLLTFMLVMAGRSI